MKINEWMNNKQFKDLKSLNIKMEKLIEELTSDKLLSDEQIADQYNDFKCTHIEIEKSKVHKDWFNFTLELEFPDADHPDFSDYVIENGFYNREDDRWAFDNWYPQETMDQLIALVLKEIEKSEAQDLIESELFNFPHTKRDDIKTKEHLMKLISSAQATLKAETVDEWKNKTRQDIATLEKWLKDFKEPVNESEDFYHYSTYNNCKDKSEIRNLIKQIKVDIKDADTKELKSELKQDLEKAKALLSCCEDLNDKFDRLSSMYPQTIKVTEIDWDTDGEDVELPKELEIPEMDEDDIADYLSDEHGFCVNSFKLDESVNKEIKLKLNPNKYHNYDFTFSIFNSKKHGESLQINAFNNFGDTHDYAFIPVADLKIANIYSYSDIASNYVKNAMTVCNLEDQLQDIYNQLKG